MQNQVRYYENETDDFEENDIVPIKIDSKYKYIHKNPFWNICEFVCYRVLATPIAYIYTKMKFGLKIENREVLKNYKNTGYFMYGNHTQNMNDAFAPTLVNFPKSVKVIVHPNNVSIPFWGNVIKFLGPLPIPDDLNAARNFLSAISYNISKKRVVMMYPEAHVWNYYTKIRDFSSNVFKYPLRENAPTFAVTTTYKKWKKDRPRIVMYIDGPFYANEELNQKEKMEDLKKKVCNAMNERAKENELEFIKYVKKKEGEYDKSNVLWK